MIETRFKDTEIGRIPEDWEVFTLDTISNVKTGPFGSALHASDYVLKGTPIITVEHLGSIHIDDTRTIPQVDKTAYKRLNAYILKTGDIVFSRVGAVDRCSCVFLKESGWLFSSRLLRVRINKAINSEYLTWHLSTREAKQRILSVAVGLAMPSINSKILKEFKVIVPSDITEQNNIASALTSIDNLISSLDKLIEKKKNIKQGAMQQLLTGKKRLKGFTEPWEQKYMWQVTTWDKKFNGVASYMQKDSIKYPYVLANVFEELETHGGNVLLLSTGNYVGWTTEEKAGLHLCEGEVVAIPGGGVANVKYANGKFVTADNRIATSADINVLDNKYLYYQMLFRSDEINSFYRGASIKHPSMLDVLTMILQIPSIKEQKAIASVLTSMDNELSALESKKAKYESLKQGMMQQLLTGKIRLIKI